MGNYAYLKLSKLEKRRMEFVADLHVHTVASGHAYSTVMECAREAAKKGLKMIAITDHGPSMPGAPHAYHFGNLAAIPDWLFGVRILKGIEANIIDRHGNIDLDEKRLFKLDVVLAGLHSACAPYGSVNENTAMMINAMKNPWVDVITHPGNPEYPINEEAIVLAAIENDIALEVNNSSLTVSRAGSRPCCSKIIRLAKQHGTKLIVGTDSHFAMAVGEFRQALGLLNENGAQSHDVLNCSVESIIVHLMRRNNRCKPVEYIVS